MKKLTATQIITPAIIAFAIIIGVYGCEPSPGGPLRDRTWQYGDLKDAMRETTEHHARVLSSEGNAVLVLFRNQKGLSGVSLRAHDALDGQPSALPNLWTLLVSIKFDEGAIEKWTLVGAGGFGFKDALFNPDDSKRFVAQLYSARTVRIEAKLYGADFRVFTFDVSGLEPGW